MILRATNVPQGLSTHQVLFSALHFACLPLLDRAPGPERVCLGPAGTAWILDLVQERFCNMDPGGFEGTFIKAGDSETRKGLE